MPAPQCILIVDDNALTLLTLTRILEQHGYCVLGANSAGSGLQLVQHQPVDLVVMDYHLPDGDIELGPALKQMRPELPVVVFSGDPEAAQAAAFADLLLPKPQEPERLVAEIRRLLRGGRAEQAA
ncbi:MAG TPA: response regulator [Terriglobales bacterium]|nr:response regulator [Terriglobales bacterium]